MTGGKLRALFLSMLMVGSVFGGTVTLSGTVAANHASPIVVDDDGSGQDYHTIQEAINHAASGATIEVSPGIYTEDVSVNKSVSLVAPDGATIVGQSSGKGALAILSEDSAPTSVSNVRIEGFRIEQGGAGSAIGVETGGPSTPPNTNLQFVDNTVVVTSDGVGVLAGNFEDSVFRNNTFEVESGTARELVFIGGHRTYALSSSNVSILNNTFTGDLDRSTQSNGGNAVEMEANNSEISGNDFTGVTTDRGILVHDFGSGNSVTDNIGAVHLSSDSARVFGQIQVAVDNANAGDTIIVSEGTFGTFQVTEEVTLDGAGEGSTVIRGSGTGDVVDLLSTGITIRDVSIENGNNGIHVNRPVDASDFKLINSTLRNNDFGVYVEGDTVNQPSPGGAFSGVLFDDVNVLDSTEKGFYIEKLDNAIFQNVIVDGVTSTTGPYNNGIDINLKNGTYENIQIRDTVVTNVSKGDPLNGNPSFSAAIAIKARDDAHKDYGQHPGHLNNVTLDNVTVSNSFNGLRFGEPGSVNHEPTNITVKNSKFINNQRYHIQDARIGVPMPDIRGNTNVFVGDVVVVNETQPSPEPEHPTTIWSNIQDGVDFADDGDGDVVFVRNGTYDPITIGKSVSVVGDSNNRPVIDAGGNDGITLNGANNLGIANFVVRNARYGMYFYHGDADPVENLSVRNVTLVDNNRGLYAPSATSTALVHKNIGFHDVVASDNMDRGMWFVASVNNILVEDSAFRRNGGAGLDFGVSPNVDINYSENSQVGVINITAEDNDYGLSAHEVDGMLVDDSHFINNTEVSIIMNGVSNASVANNNIRESGTGFKLVEENFGFSSFNPVVSNINFRDNDLLSNTIQVNDTTGTLNMIAVAQNNTFDKGVSVGAFDPATIFGTIQGGVDAAEPNDLVTVGPGMYTETVTIDKDVTLQGLQNAEGANPSVLDGRITVTADGATVREIRVDRADEFLPGQPTTAGILVSANNTLVEESVVTVRGNAGVGSDSVTVDGIQVWSGGPDVSNITVRNNTIVGISNDGSAGWPNYGGATGIKVQGSVADVEVVNNDIANVWSAGWSYGIVMTPSGNAPDESPTNVQVDGNQIQNVTADELIGVGVGIDTLSGNVGDPEKMHAGDVSIHQNAFDKTSVGVLNKDQNAIANATHNYWGHPSGPRGPGADIIGNVTFKPYYIDADLTRLVAPGSANSASVQNDSASVSLSATNTTVDVELPNSSNASTVSVVQTDAPTGGAENVSENAIYMDISTDVSVTQDVEITVAVSVNSLTAQGIPPAQATLQHYNDTAGEWVELDTDVDIQGGTATLTATADGLSPFAVTERSAQSTGGGVSIGGGGGGGADQAQMTTETPTPTPAPTPTPTPTATPEPTPTATAEPPATDQPPATTEAPVREPGGFDLSTIVLIALGLVVLIAAAAIARRRLR